MSEEAAQHTHPPVIMVVDDNDEIRSLLRIWFEQHDCRVVEAAGGSEAVEIAREERPDLILMDLHMPHIDGFAAAYRVRLLSGLGSSVPIIAISADGVLGIEVQHPSEAHEVGFNDFILKPFSPAQLQDILDRYLPQDRSMSGG